MARDAFRSATSQSGVKSAHNTTRGASLMGFLLEQVMPEGVTVEFLDEVTDEMDIEANLPDTFVSHVHFMRDGKAHVVDVWQTKEAYDTFSAERLGPALAKVAERHGIAMNGPGPESTWTEVARVVAH
jgi:hypothetical protein